MKKDDKKYKIYQRDGQDLILIDEYTYEEIDELYESIKKEYALIYFRGVYFIFKWKTQKTTD